MQITDAQFTEILKHDDSMRDKLHSLIDLVDASEEKLLKDLLFVDWKFLAGNQSRRDWIKLNADLRT